MIFALGLVRPASPASIQVETLSESRLTRPNYAIAEKRIAEAQMQPPLPAFRLTSGRSRPLTGTQIEMDLKERGG